jgi:hypothetical protein
MRVSTICVDLVPDTSTLLGSMCKVTAEYGLWRRKQADTSSQPTPAGMRYNLNFSLSIHIFSLFVIIPLLLSTFSQS